MRKENVNETQKNNCASDDWCAPRQVDSEKNISFSASWFYQLAVFLCCL